MVRFKILETCNTKSVDFPAFIYEENTLYSWTIRIMCYVKVWKFIIATCSLVLLRGFLIRWAILVINYSYSIGTLSSHKWGSAEHMLKIFAICPRHKMNWTSKLYTNRKITQKKTHRKNTQKKTPRKNKVRTPTNQTKPANVPTLLRLIWSQTDFSLMSNQTEKRDYNPDIVRFNNIQNWYLCV